MESQLLLEGHRFVQMSFPTSHAFDPTLEDDPPVIRAPKPSHTWTLMISGEAKTALDGFSSYKKLEHPANCV